MALTAGSSAGHFRQYADRAAFDVSSLTVSAWVYWNSSGSSQRVATRGTLTVGGDWAMGITAGGSRFFGVHVGGSARNAAAGGGPSTGVWYHYLGFYDHTTGGVDFLINNSSAATASGGTGALSASTADIRLFETTSAGAHGNLRIAHLGCWGVVLTAEERAALYAGAHPLSIRPTSLFLGDELHLASVDFMGGNPTDTGANLANADGPPNLRYISKAPRRGRRVAASAQSPLLLRLHNERLFTGGFA